MIHLHTEDFPIIAYRKLGNGPVIMLLHGFPESGELWRQIGPVLAHSFTVIIPDLPGTGESVFAHDSVSIEDLAKSVNYILEKEQIDKAVLAGHSMGGYVALAFAELYPAKVTGLSMVHSSAYDDNEEKKLTRRKSIELIRKGAKETFIKQMVPNLFSPAFKNIHPEAVEKQITHGLRLNAETMIAFYEAMMNRPNRIKLLADTHFPMQWLLGKNDNVIPYKTTLKQSHLTNVNFVSIYQDCGHLGMLEQPQKMSDDLMKFITYCSAKKEFIE